MVSLIRSAIQVIKRASPAYGKRRGRTLLVINHQRSCFRAWLFMLSKVPETIDTLFIVLRRQPLIFLHWYHHASVLVYCFYRYARPVFDAVVTETRPSLAMPGSSRRDVGLCRWTTAFIRSCTDILRYVPQKFVCLDLYKKPSRCCNYCKWSSDAWSISLP